MQAEELLVRKKDINRNEASSIVETSHVTSY